MRRQIRAARRAGLNVLAVLVRCDAVPILCMVATASSRPARSTRGRRILLPAPPTHRELPLGHRRQGDRAAVWDFLKNSLFVTLSSVIASMLISLLCAIAVASSFGSAPPT